MRTRASITLSAAALPAEPPAVVISQRRQIGPFAAAQVHVTAATVVGRRVGERECAASAVAVRGPDQGATRTG